MFFFLKQSCRAGYLWITSNSCWREVRCRQVNSSEEVNSRGESVEFLNAKNLTQSTTNSLAEKHVPLKWSRIFCFKNKHHDFMNGLYTKLFCTSNVYVKQFDFSAFFFEFFFGSLYFSDVYSFSLPQAIYDAFQCTKTKIKSFICGLSPSKWV